ncbi:MAG: sugar phosphate isomerase/epimerase [Planctomycetota bacterium]|nr:sugar phosphate isomerase/epimerase [Planctomycetota bacterium]
MSEIELACHIAPWGNEGMIHALSDIERARFKGIEMSSTVVELYEDRVGVFNEILVEHHLQLYAITAGGSMWPGMNLDEEVERCLNIARFLKASGARALNLYPPRPNPESPIEDELDLMPAATAYGEIARRTLEQDVVTCLHPEMGTCVEDVKTMEKFLEMADPEALKICVDSGWLAEAGLPLAGFVKDYKKRIGMVHLRDLKLKKGKVVKVKVKKKVKGKTVTEEHALAVELGKGGLDLESYVDALLTAEFNGCATIEFDPPEPGAGTLREIAAASHVYAEHTLDLVL